MDPDLVTTEDAGRMLGYVFAGWQHLLESDQRGGVLPPLPNRVKVGNDMFFKRSELRNWQKQYADALTRPPYRIG